MLNLDYLKRLGRNGGKLGWRVLMLLLPVVGYSLWQAVKQMFGTTQIAAKEEQEEYGVHSDGTPWVENIEHEAWEALYGKDAKRI
ncbi:MAG: hypothetical protein KA222_00085 [Pseudoxanthomonas sp.]|jgi:hypothetical protein|nr:hypothetical protein [Pseudoxanthomonas sp.]HRL52859.1 hypothetical protein [Acidovorax temperans]